MLLAAAACAVGAGRYREEVRMMQEVIDLSDDLIDRYRRNDDRLLKLQEFRTASQGNGEFNALHCVSQVCGEGSCHQEPCNAKMYHLCLCIV